jgi:DeoR/GlpR family transcriptional regulator of sugar metabolism
MENNERQEAILKLLKDNNSVKVSKLSRGLFVSEATVRRDLEKLEKRGYLRRTYGGAMRIESLDSEIPLDLRRNENPKFKERISLLAVKQIENGNVISIDSSTTALYM